MLPSRCYLPHKATSICKEYLCLLLAGRRRIPHRLSPDEYALMWSGKCRRARGRNRHDVLQCVLPDGEAAPTLVPSSRRRSTQQQQRRLHGRLYSPDRERSMGEHAPHSGREMDPIAAPGTSDSSSGQAEGSGRTSDSETSEDLSSDGSSSSSSSGPSDEQGALDHPCVAQRSPCSALSAHPPSGFELVLLFESCSAHRLRVGGHRL